MQRIAATILTYNRKDLLRRCLDCVFAQSRPCDRVIVIDNASTDGTAEMLRQEWGSSVEVHTLARNVGASGGFNFGVRAAYQAGADFAWLMDDDVLPEKHALARLLEAEEQLSASGTDHAFVVSSVWNEDGTPTNVPKVDTRPGPGGYESWPLFLGQKMLPVTRSTFVSMLLPRATIAEYGLPLAPMFIWGEDSEYTLRVTAKRPGFMIADSRVLHLRQLSGAINILTEVNPTRLGYHRHFIRNHMYIARMHSAKLEYIRHAIRQVQLVLRLIRLGEFAKAKIVMTGIAESFRFHPVIEPADTQSPQIGVEVNRSQPASPSTVIGQSEARPPAV